ncbi:hypothetical protein PVAP13_3KG531730 [Panicum virgatum]|uniref:Leucine-rich repeat-containing N-terminal plant-type domain-containing protein n=1 Tax=Panicum virgatum TaxID=38727 RepID=A0A8T0VCK8_PANVG|nr:hypothetical protein PVAP13_3KG531730 [Panicum virgatum]
MASIVWALLLCLVQLHSLVASSAHPDGNLTHHSSTPLCRPDQANALLKLKQSFMFHSNSESEDSLLDSIPTLPAWQAGTDCCIWEGVGCSNSTGHVTSLNLGGFGLYINGIDPALFNLTSLRLLDLSANNFGSRWYEIPSVGFERLALLTHLNLSGSGISGQVPVGISKLTNLVSLDLSNGNIYTDDDPGSYAWSGTPNSLWEHNFPTLVANLSNLRELYLDRVYLSPSTAEDCFKALANSVPHLRVLSLEHCWLQGHIGRSLSRLHFLVVINLSNNPDITPGPFPEFVMNFLNLRVLQLSGINLEGQFPHGIFRSENLRVVDLSLNPNLLGHMPNFSNATSLETLRIEWTNFSYVKSSYFSDFTALTELGLDGKIISRYFLSSFGMLESLRRLVLARLDLPRESESFFSWFQGIRNLRSLQFYDCDLSLTIPSSTGNLKNLISLVISESNLTTQTLSAVANIRSLRFLDIEGWGCSLGPLPSAIGNMTSLERLSILGCQLSGPIPQEVGAIKKLTSLTLPDIGLSGRIPSSMANLTLLTELWLGGNSLREIPASLFTLPALECLDLSSNQLSGPIHEFEGVSSHLKVIYLGGNELTGQIPRSLMILPNLTILHIEGNNLMGSVDLGSSLWRLENLTYLYLSHNNLTVMEGKGSNSSSTYPSRLVGLGLASCNMTKIPNLLMRLKNMDDLDLSSNKISGDIPNWIWNNDLSRLNLSNNMFTGMEHNSSHVIPRNRVLYFFDLSSNKLQGQIPMPCLSAVFLDYSNNMFSSFLPNFTLYLSSTRYLKLSNNNISAHLPHSICHSRVEILDLSFNNFSGPVPPCLMEKRYLRVLNLRENQFKGMLPTNISSGCSVETIDLHGNKIEGQIPRALHNCTNLEVLDLGRNQIADTFPSWLGRLLNLHVLILRSNQFHGSIDYLEDEKSGEQFSSLQIVDLASNNFSAVHPQWFENLKSMKKYNNTGQIIDHPNPTQGFYQDSVSISYKGFFVTFDRILTTLTAIDISDNALEGIIPVSIGNLVSLHVLNMSHNAFSGEIPPQLGSITALESLDLSSNMLSGEIPQELTNLTFLSTLNLSNNQLDGSIPQSRQFGTFQNSSFDGNVGLCGPPLSKQCGSMDAQSKTNLKSSSHSVDVVLFLFVGVGFGVGFAAAIIVKLDWIKKWFHI